MAWPPGLFYFQSGFPMNSSILFVAGLEIHPKYSMCSNLLFLFSLCWMYLHKKIIHRRSQTKYLAGVRVDSCCFYTAHIFVGDVFNHHADAASCWGWSSPGTRPMCKAGFFFAGKKPMCWLTCIQLPYRQGRVHPQSRDSWKSWKRLVWMMSLSWSMDSSMTMVIIPGTSWKENDSKSQVFSNVFLEFPDIFVTAPPESCVHVLNKIVNDASHNYIDQYIWFKFSSISILTEPDLREEISLWTISPKCLDVNQPDGHMCSLTNPTIEPWLKCHSY